MSKQRNFHFIMAAALVCLAFAETALSAVDRIEVKGGVVLAGEIEDSSQESIRLKTDFAGMIDVKTDSILKIHTEKKLSGDLPEGLVAQAESVPSAADKQKSPEEPSAARKSDQTSDKPAVAVKAPTKKPEVAAKAPAKKPSPPKSKAESKYGWELEVGMNLTGNEGNSDKMDFGFNIDSRYVQKFYRIDLYSRYAYATNRDKLTSNEIVLGSRYTNFFYKKFGFFVREELEHDQFEAIDLRSTTGGGFSYKVYDDKEMNLEVRSGLSYRYEEYDNGNAKDFPGMDFGLDFRWQFAPMLSFKGSYAFIPSFDDSEEFIVTQNSGIEIPLSRNSQWKLRLGLTTKYNNKPNRNRQNMDHKYYVRFLATWK